MTRTPLQQEALRKATLAAMRKADDKKAEHLRARGWVCFTPDELDALTVRQLHRYQIVFAGLSADKLCAFPIDARKKKPAHDHQMCIEGLYDAGVQLWPGA